VTAVDSAIEVRGEAQRRVAELMAAVGAPYRFQAGLRARELVLV
jgi:hypothetical protein